MADAVGTPTAAVTGATGGLGRSFVRKLLQRGYRAWLIDRDREALQGVLRELEPTQRAACETITTDLTSADSVAELVERLQAEKSLEILVNNAGFGMLADFLNANERRLRDMIDVHCVAPMRLTRAVLPGMIARRSGFIINVASLGAFAPSRKSVQYAATKAYLVVLSQGLQEELAGTGVKIQALCPGFVRTGFHLQDDMRGFREEHEPAIPKRFWMMPDEVVEYSLAQRPSEEVLVIPGWRFRLLGLAMRMPLLQPVVRRMTRPRAPSSPRPI